MRAIRVSALGDAREGVVLEGAEARTAIFAPLVTLERGA